MGVLLLIVGLAIIGYSWIGGCIGFNGVPYDINKITSCMLSLRNITLTGIGTLIAFIGALLSYYSN